MTPRLRATIAIAAALLAASRAAPAGAADLPDWMRDLRGASVANAGAAPATVLVRDMRVVVNPDGEIRTTERVATQFGSASGRSHWRGFVVYDRKSDDVRRANAWTISPAGAAGALDGRRQMDAAIVAGDVLGEVRARGYLLDDELAPGTIAGFESECDRRVLLPQLDFDFQDGSDSVVVSRFSIAVPKGWWVRARLVHHAPVEGRVDGAVTTWELRDLPAIPEEPFDPAAASLRPRLLVDWGPAAAPAESLGWTRLGAWLAGKNDPRAAPTETIARKAHELTAAARGDSAKIAAVARFTQGVRYVSIQTGLWRGGGFVPRPAEDVLASGYGDCKDKANLMRGLLAAAGVPAWLVAVYSGDATHVIDAWPSLQQFNHCIVAVKAPDDLRSPAVLSHPTLGRLLIFDPTDDCTALGDLPRTEQGSFGLLQAASGGGLLRLPELPAEGSAGSCRVDVALEPTGALKADVRLSYSGQRAADARRTRREFGEEGYRGIVERWIAASVPGAIVESVEPQDDSAGDFRLRAVFRSRAGAQRIQDGLLAFRPALLTRPGDVVFTGATRRLPIVFPSGRWADTLTVRLPEHFAAEDLAAPFTVEEDFGRYEARTSVEGGMLQEVRSYVTRPVVVPPEQYDRVRRFEDRVHRFESRAVLLRAS